jgi:hypothetical protein
MDIAEVQTRSALAEAHPELSHLSKDEISQSFSSLLGFTVNEHGLATPARESTSERIEQGPPTPPKTEKVRTPGSARPNLWQSRRASVLGSLTNLQKQMEQKLHQAQHPATPTASEGTARSSLDGQSANDNTEQGSGFASMFAKRFKEARDNASDLLREAERKLGTAMTMDDLLGVRTEQAERDARSASPRIQLDGRETGYARQPVLDQPARSPRMEARQLEAESSPWFEAAGGRRSESGLQRSPSLAPAHDAERRSSTSSGRSSLSLPQGPDRRCDASPPLGASVGSGVYGLLRQTLARSDAQDDGTPLPTSHTTLSSTDASSWDWTAKDDCIPGRPDRSSMVSVGRSDAATPQLDKPSQDTERDSHEGRRHINVA